MGNFALYTVGGLAVSIEIKKKARIKQLEAQVASIKADSQKYLDKGVELSDQLVKATQELETTKGQLHEALMKLGAIVHILKPELQEVTKGCSVSVSFVELHKLMPKHAIFQVWPNDARDIMAKVEGLDEVRKFSRLATALPQGTKTAHVRYCGTLYSVPREVCKVVIPNADI